MTVLKTVIPKIITKTYLYNFDSLTPHFYTLKLGFTGVYIPRKTSSHLLGQKSQEAQSERCY